MAKMVNYLAKWPRFGRGLAAKPLQVDTDVRMTDIRVRATEQVPVLLGHAPGLVDVLASGTEYVAYLVFDSEGLTN